MTRDNCSHTFNLEEGGQELVLVLLCGNWVCKLLAIVEGLQEGLEAVVEHRHPCKRPRIGLARGLSAG